MASQNPENDEQEQLSLSMGELLDLKKEQIGAIMMMGYRLYEQGRLLEAAKIFEGLAVLDRGNAYVKQILGTIHQKLEELETALKRYNRRLELFPYDTYALTKRGEIMMKLGRYQEAAEDFRQAIQLDPKRKDPAAKRASLLVNTVREALSLAKKQ